MTTKAEVLKVIRAKCMDCSCYQYTEVEQCPVHTCALHSFRFGKDPNPAKGGRKIKGFTQYAKEA